MFYGGENTARRVSADDVLALQEHWFRHGQIPFDAAPALDASPSPECPLCATPLDLRRSADGRVPLRCLGCNSTAILDPDTEALRCAGAAYSFTLSIPGADHRGAEEWVVQVAARRPVLPSS